MYFFVVKETYGEAAMKLNKAEETSDLQSQAEEEEQQLKSHKRKYASFNVIQKSVKIQ